MTKVEISNRTKFIGAPLKLQEAIERRLTFVNPKWIENNRQGRWNGDTPEHIECFEATPEGSLVVPRGFTGQLLRTCFANNEPFQIDDRRRSLPPVDLKFQGVLKPFQADAVDVLLKKDFGTLSAPTGAGKTIMALSAVAIRQQPTCILVHTKELLNQWSDRIETFLGIPRAEIGIIGGGKRNIGDLISVAMVQTLYKCATEVSRHVGFLVVDECHRCPSRTFTEAVEVFDSKYMLGLSATPYRRDKLSRLIYWYLGDVRHKIERTALQDTGDILQVEAIYRETDFESLADPVNEYSQMLKELTENDQRNIMIASDVEEVASNSEGICLILSDRKGHCQALGDLLRARLNAKVEILTGDTPAPNRRQIVKRLNAGEVKVLIATGALIGEGFDCKGLSTLFLATPVKFSGRLIQYLGRILRPAPGKGKATVYDYVDVNVGPLLASANSRARVYNNFNAPRGGTENFNHIAGYGG